MCHSRLSLDLKRKQGFVPLFLKTRPGSVKRGLPTADWVPTAEPGLRPSALSAEHPVILEMKPHVLCSSQTSLLEPQKKSSQPRLSVSEALFFPKLALF